MLLGVAWPPLILILWVAIPALSASLYAYLLAVYQRRRRGVTEPTERWLVLFLLAASLWSVSSMWVHAMPIRQGITEILVRVLAMANFALPLTVFAFVAHYLALPRAQRLIVYGVIGYVFVSALTAAGWVVRNVRVEQGLIYQTWGPGVVAVAVYWGGLMYSASYLVLREWRRTRHPDFRVRLAYLLGACVALIVGNSLNVFLSEYPVDQLFAAIAAVLIAFNLVYGSSAPAQQAVLRGVILVVAGLLYVVFFAGAIYLISHLATGVAILVSVALAVVSAFLLLAYPPTRERIVHFVERYLFDEAEFTQLLYRLTEVGSRLRLPSELAQDILQVVTDTLPVAEAALLLRDDLKGMYIPVATRGLPEEAGDVSFAPDSPLIQILQKQTQGITVEQLAEMPEARGLWVKEWDALRTLRAEVLVPISVEGDLVGFFTFGQRTDGVPYSQRELQHWLPHLARHVAIMVDNSRLYARVQAEATLLSRVNEELQELNRMKSHLLQNVSHELRTPLTLIIGYADLLRQKVLTEEKEIAEAGEVIRQNAQHLLHLVEQLLSFQKLDTTQMTLSPLDLPAFLRQVAKSWEPALKSQGLTLRLDIAADTGWVLANADHLRQVLDNLLGNARKFSPEGTTISLRAWREGDTVYVSVSDQGIGIPPDKLDRIFERFYQVESAKRGGHGGMGIGLALCKEIIERHGGRIWAESEGEGKGATFTFTLRAVNPQQALSGNGQAAT